MQISPKIYPFLWFDGQAEEAAQYYVSLFEDAEITQITRYQDGSPMPAGTALTVSFSLAGQAFVALNGGPHYQFSEAISFQILCNSQQEVDHFWDGLLAGGGEPGPCGWLKDRFGLSWQVVPEALPRLLSGGTPAQSQRVMAAMMQMQKIEVAPLEQAFKED